LTDRVEGAGWDVRCSTRPHPRLEGCGSRGAGKIPLSSLSSPPPVILLLFIPCRGARGGGESER